jgi:hypothetical protein
VDFAIAETLRDLPASSVEELLMSVWSGVGHTDSYIQAALWAGTSRLRDAVASTLKRLSDAPQAFKYVERYFGASSAKRGNKLTLHELESLRPYVA